MSIGNIFVVVMCIVLLIRRKDYYLRKNKKGKYSLAIPKKEREAKNVIQAERELSYINNHKLKKWNNRKLEPVPNSPFMYEFDVVEKKKPVISNKLTQYKSLNHSQFEKLERLKKDIENNPF